MDRDKIEEIMYRERLHKASLTKRALAMVIDDLLISFIIVGIMWDRLQTDNLEQMLMIVNGAIIEIIIIKILYHTLFVALYGATIGKMALKIRVIEISTIDKPTFMASLNRATVRIISELAFYFGFVLAIFDSNYQALHDKSAKTLVIEYRGNED